MSTATTTPTASRPRQDTEGTYTLHLRQRQRVDRRDREWHAGGDVQLRPQRQPDRDGLHDGHGQREDPLAGRNLHVRQRRQPDRSTNTSTTSITTYTYDYRNRLTEVTQGGTIIATYTYNALNQRIGIKDNGTQTWTAYDGTNADAHPYADFNGSGSLTMRYLSAPGVFNGTQMTRF